MKKTIFFLTVFLTILGFNSDLKAGVSLRTTNSNQIIYRLPMDNNQLGWITIENSGPDTVRLLRVRVFPVFEGNGIPDSAQLSNLLENFEINSPGGVIQFGKLNFIQGSWNAESVEVGFFNTPQMMPGQTSFISLNAKVNEPAANIDNVRFLVSVTTRVDTSLGPDITSVATKKLYFKKSLDVFKKEGTPDNFVNSPMINRQLGTFQVVNLLPAPIKLMYLAGNMQGSLSGNLPKAGFLQAFSSTGVLLGNNQGAPNNNDFFISTENGVTPFIIQPGDTEEINFFGNIPTGMMPGDELSLTLSPAGEVSYYAPWEIWQPSFVGTTNQAVGEKTIFRSVNGIENAIESSLDVITPGNSARFRAEKPFHLTICNMMGQMIIDDDYRDTRIEDIPQGVYIYKAVDKETHASMGSGKFTITH